MAVHDWISGVLDDLEEYCDKHDLIETKPQIARARHVFAAELHGMAPSNMTIEQHLAHANCRPI